MTKRKGAEVVDRSAKRRQDALAERLGDPEIRKQIREIEIAASTAFANGERYFDHPDGGEMRLEIGFVSRAICREQGIDINILPGKDGRPVVHPNLLPASQRGDSCVRLVPQNLLNAGPSGWVTLEIDVDAPRGRLLEEFEAQVRRLRTNWEQLGLPTPAIGRGRPRVEEARSATVVRDGNVFKFRLGEPIKRLRADLRLLLPADSQKRIRGASPGKKARNLSMVERKDVTTARHLAWKEGITERHARAIVRPRIRRAESDPEAPVEAMTKCRQCNGPTGSLCDACPLHAEMYGEPLGGCAAVKGRRKRK